MIVFKGAVPLFIIGNNHQSRKSAGGGVVRGEDMVDMCRVYVRGECAEDFHTVEWIWRSGCLDYDVKCVGCKLGG